MTDTPIAAHQLSKTYRLGFWLARRVQALQGLELAVPRGQIYGLLGPNGAGKSTTIKILLDLVKPSSGEAKLFGLRPDDPLARRKVGYVPENPSPYEYLTGREFLSLSGRLAGLSGVSLERRVNAVLGQVEMVQASSLQIRRYSKGMVQRIALAQALIGEPEVLILDEPTSGLDPLGRRQIRDLILEQRAKGTTVLFCSHIIPDVELLCDRVAVLVGGRRVREGTVQDLLVGGTTNVELTVEGLSSEQVRALVPGAESVQALHGRSMVRVPEVRAQEALKVLVASSGRVTRMAPARYGLEELFMSALAEASRKVGSEVLE